MHGFETGTWPKERWTHGAHMVMALWYVLRTTEPETTVTVRENIKRYNEAVGGKNTDTSGYHETITIFWIWAVRNLFLAKEDPATPLVELAHKVIEFGDRSLPLHYYSREVLFSVEARRTYVPPDIKSFLED
ncbi:MAG: hypothetical protein K1Y36_14805 [Blastocatellia bacterium]|nr:hypothetical protein [Blastocatellia bacterium]